MVGCAAVVCSWAVMGLVASGEEQRQQRLYRHAGRGVDTVCLAVAGIELVLGEDVGQSKLTEIRFFEIRESRERLHVLDNHDAPLDADEFDIAELA